MTSKGKPGGPSRTPAREKDAASGGPEAGPTPPEARTEGRASGRGRGAEGHAPAADAREVAAHVLMRVAEQGAFAMRALDAELGRAQLSARDAGLATEIVYGSLRVLPALDETLRPLIKRGLAGTDALTLAVLRAAVYQLWYLERVPAHAVVDSAVGLIRRARSRQSAGFVNAVLRRLCERRPAQPAPATRIMVPRWLERCLLDALGEARVEAMLSHDGDVPPLGLAVSSGDRELLAREIAASLPRASSAAGVLSPRAVVLRRAGDPRRLPGYAEGRFWVQEEGAQLVALAVGARPGERLVDACAGHGGKTLMMAVELSGQGHVTSIDLDESKLDRIPPELARMGLHSGVTLELEPIDLSVGTGGLGPSFDRVLVDAPCSGLGTVHRRPELLLRLTEEDLVRMGALQLSILRNAARLVRPGGTLTYAVCSPSLPEGSGVATAFEASTDALTRLDPAAHLPEIRADSDQILRLGPWLRRGPSVPDAYQVVSWRIGA